MAGRFTVAARHQGGRSGLVASRGEHHAVERIPRQNLDQPKIGEVAIERGSGPLARLLNRMRRKFKRHPARIAYARLHSLGKRYMDAVAWNQVAAALRDANDRPSRLKFSTGNAVVAVAFQVDGRFSRFFVVIEPDAAAQFLPLVHLIAQIFVDYVFERLSVGKPVVLLQEKLHRLVEPLLGVIGAVG